MQQSLWVTFTNWSLDKWLPTVIFSTSPVFIHSNRFGGIIFLILTESCRRHIPQELVNYVNISWVSCVLLSGMRYNTYLYTVLPRASGYGHSQFKHWKLRVGGCTKEVGAWMVQAPTLDMMLAARGCQINLHHRFTYASLRLAQQWRKLYHARSELSCGLFGKFTQHSLLAVCKFCAAGEERGNKATNVCVNLWCWMLCHLKCINMIAAMYVSSVDLLSIDYTRI